MATTYQDYPVPSTTRFGVCRLIVWTLASNESGDPVQFTEFSDKCVQVSGSFSGGAAVLIEGSNDLTSPTTWTTITDPQANALSKTSAAIEQILETPMWIRPRISGGDGSTAIRIAIVARRQDVRGY
jgi:hypothetical protein